MRRQRECCGQLTVCRENPSSTFPSFSSELVVVLALHVPIRQRRGRVGLFLLPLADRSRQASRPVSTTPSTPRRSWSGVGGGRSSPFGPSRAEGQQVNNPDKAGTLDRASGLLIKSVSLALIGSSVSFVPTLTTKQPSQGLRPLPSFSPRRPVV